MNKKQETIDSYNNHASAYADRFNNVRTRALAIEETFSYIKKSNPKVLEIGCANGRDAKIIIRYTNGYLGIDISEKLIEIARKNVPEAKFEVADIESYDFPENIDVILAFSSLIHSDMKNLRKILDESYRSMARGGVMYLSMKYGDYHEETIESEIGSRTYYFYTFDDIKKMIGGKFTILKEEIEHQQNQDWIEMIIRKI